MKLLYANFEFVQSGKTSNSEENTQLILTLELRTMSISTFWFFNVNFFVLFVIVMS